MRMRVLFAALLLFSAPLYAAVTAVDDRGRAITLAAPAARIVSLAPHITESLYAAGAGGKVVAVAAHSDYPAAAQRLPVVADYSGVDFERLLALKPDLVVAWASGNAGGAVEKLEALGIPVYVSEPRGLAGVAGALESLGALAGTETAARDAARRLRADIETLRREYQSRAPVTVFYQIWGDPLITVGGAHVISDVIALCGGRNIFADLAPLAPTVSLEAVLAADPQVILGGSDLPPSAALRYWREWPRLAAVRGDNLFTVPADWLHRPAPRMVEGARRVCAHLDTARGRLEKYQFEFRSSRCETATAAKGESCASPQDPHPCPLSRRERGIVVAFGCKNGSKPHGLVPAANGGVFR